jgi:hypothetical protein
MTVADDDVLELIGRLDPALTEHPPRPGSDRYRSVLETAMTGSAAVAMTESAAVAMTDSVAAATVVPLRGRRRGSRRVAVAAAVAAAAVAAYGLWQPGDEQSAQAAVRQATESLAEITSFEMSGTDVDAEGRVTTYAARIDGGDFEVAIDGFFDGPVENLTFTAVDRFVYLTEDGRTSRTPRQPGEGADAYPALSAELLAVLDASDVSELGQETVAGVVTTRYDIAPTDRSVAAFSALGPIPELDEPPAIERLSVWIADDRLHQIEVVHDDGRAVRVTLFNLDGEITITPPPGPYVEPTAP